MMVEVVPQSIEVLIMPLQAAHPAADDALRAPGSSLRPSPHETAAISPEIDRSRCKGCGLCVEYCPFGRLVLDDDLNQAGYHTAVLRDEPVSPAAGVADENGGVTAVEVGDALAHNVSFWCPRCRYCETVCPDAAIRVSGPTDGLEGVSRRDVVHAPRDAGGHEDSGGPRRRGAGSS